MTPMSGAEPLELEREGWQALSAGADRALAFYQQVLDDPVLMLLPGGLVLDDRAGALKAMSGQPWSSYRLADEQVRVLSPDVVAVVYAVVARRGCGRLQRPGEQHLPAPSGWVEAGPAHADPTVTTSAGPGATAGRAGALVR